MAAPAPDPRALLTIVLAEGGLSAADRADLRRAVQSARARKPAVAFEVTAILAPDAADSGPGAAAVARAITEEGVAARRIRLAARPEPGASGREIRVYVE